MEGWKVTRYRSDHKPLYNGTSSSRNGVGVAVSESPRNKIAAVDQLSDRLMSIKIDIGRKILRIATAYAPQTGCKEGEKDMFWQYLDDYITSIPQDEILLLGADLNGHVGEKRI
ncbi:unnamed protein product, partial [Strongylus vulgaris]